ncbi:hypothetical protein [uncultured Desulfosarcina sp.]|uniref:hypothetical protein n=1 Tax=uncultured Desulfosarcina sp. TaxID=218289 RepID=UPI0029C86434|nr:hypothetical protein [uncultured Desulfosarcina sp.]
MEAIDLNGLTQEEVAKVKHFIISLKKIRAKSDVKRFRFNWAGGLRDVFPGKTSVDLQHESANWR